MHSVASVDLDGDNIILSILAVNAKLKKLELQGRSIFLRAIFYRGHLLLAGYTIAQGQSDNSQQHQSSDFIWIRVG